VFALLSGLRRRLSSPRQTDVELGPVRLSLCLAQLRSGRRLTSPLATEANSAYLTSRESSFTPLGHTGHKLRSAPTFKAPLNGLRDAIESRKQARSTGTLTSSLQLH